MINNFQLIRLVLVLAPINIYDCFIHIFIQYNDYYHFKRDYNEDNGKNEDEDWSIENTDQLQS